jgi:hypothetical protein
MKEQSLYSQMTSQVWAQIWSCLPPVTWFLPFLGSIVTILSLLIFGSCLFNLLVKLVSSYLESIKLQMIVHAEAQFH